MDHYQSLANAIVLQATKDWREAVKKLKKNSVNPDATATKKECEDFFLSGWFQHLTAIDGDYLLKQLTKEAAE